MMDDEQSTSGVTGPRNFPWPSAQVAQSLVDRLPNPRAAMENALARGFMQPSPVQMMGQLRASRMAARGEGGHGHSHAPGRPCPHHGVQQRRPVQQQEGEHTAIMVEDSGDEVDTEDHAPPSAPPTLQSPPSATAAAASALGAPLMKYIQSFLPFLLLLLMKVLYNHRLGLLVLVGLILAFQHANSRVARKVMVRVFRQDNLRWRDTDGPVVWSIVILSLSLVSIYCVFYDEALYRVLIFYMPNVERMDLWTLLWVVCLTDFVLKYITVIVKAVISLLPESLIRYKAKGSYYVLVEGVSMYYRSLVPIVPWINFLLDDEHGGPWFSACLLVFYTAYKAYQLYYKTHELRQLLAFCKHTMSYGVIPPKDKVQASESCPICQDDFREPVMLSCEHVFCEDCVNIWFMQEKTCPMCRCVIEQTLQTPPGRDGVTGGMLVLF